MIWLVRHGETQWNRAGRYQGRSDSPLTERGVAQARRMGDTLAGLVDPPACTVLSSPLGRAVCTAEIIRERARIAAQIEIDDRLREISLGCWDGLTDDEVEAVSPNACDGADRYNWFFRAPDGESYQAAMTRLSAALEDLGDPCGDIIVVSHGLAGRLFRGAYLGLPQAQTLRLDVPQDAVFKLWSGRVERISCVDADAS